ncbi:outer membrane protein assembly factor BamD [Abyssalbus ytuae]|uniref:Outer membrane protein assembly factor BamD n=1 Tax=Abyssalbus ytuae TaxID=2926907 RepID=A0A9E7CZM4_9FLAO|nr:outer membrane protein assembly factor BamD [Abyssalbus ytuae]UOB17680.1 outer membrane protein assembly factor BamD [Abyssalbus ytuae]
MIRFSILVTVLLLAFSCSEYQKALKSEDIKVKYELAEKLYNEGNYKKAVRLFEQIATQYAGKPQGERIYYFMADSYYNIEDYYLSAYQFERFAKSYPRSEKVEEALFYNAKSQYKLSPKYSIDQAETNTALEKLQVFINKYPESEHMEEANKMTLELRTKLEKKAFEIAKQYNRIKDYKAAIKSWELFLSEYPGSVYREDALFQKMLASYNLAMNSIYNRQEERLNDTKSVYNTLKRFYSQSKYLREADKMLEDINNELEKFSKQS